MLQTCNAFNAAPTNIAIILVLNIPTHNTSSPLRAISSIPHTQIQQQQFPVVRARNKQFFTHIHFVSLFIIFFLPDVVSLWVF